MILQAIKAAYEFIAVLTFILAAAAIAAVFYRPFIKVLFETAQEPCAVVLRLLIQVCIFILLMIVCAALAAIWPIVPIILGILIHLDAGRSK